MRRRIILALSLTASVVSSNCSDTPSASGVTPSPNDTAPIANATYVNSGSVAGGGEGQSGTGSSISSMGVVVVTDTNANGLPDRGDTITFSISTTQKWSQVSVECAQSGTVVLRAVRTPNAWSAITLASQAWQTGSADCVVTLEQFNGTKVMTLASTSFVAGA